MKSKYLYSIGIILLLLNIGYQPDYFFAAEVSSIETNKNVGFYGEIDYEGDPKPQPPSEEKPQPSDKDNHPKLEGQLPRLNQLIKNYGLLGLITFLFAIRRWKKNRNKKNIRVTAVKFLKHVK